jgi:beta-N-acetylhexosaminidase
MDLAPVLDLDDRPGPSATNPDGTRSFSIDPSVATRYGLAFAHGLQRSGVVPVVKHFPGLGYATANTDVKPAWTLPWSTLQHQGLLPFEAAVGAGLPAVMVSNARVPGLTHLPSTLSSHVVSDVLRGQLHFGGLLMTDSLSAGAVSGAGYSVRRAAVRALEVGEDMVLFNADPGAVASTWDQVVRAIVRAVRHGHLPRARLREAADHVLTAKGAAVCR